MYSKTRTVMLITCLLLLCKFGLDQVSATQQQRRTREEVVKEREQLPKKAFEKFFRPDAKGEVYVTKAAHVRPGKKDFGVSAGRVVEETEPAVRLEWYAYFKGVTGFQDRTVRSLESWEAKKYPGAIEVAAYEIKAEQMRFLQYGKFQETSTRPGARKQPQAPNVLLTKWATANGVFATVTFHKYKDGEWRLHEVKYVGPIPYPYRNMPIEPIVEISSPTVEEIWAVESAAAQEAFMNPQPKLESAPPVAPVINDPDGARVITDNFIECEELNGNWFTMVNNNTLLEIGSIDWRKSGSSLLILGGSYRIHGTHRNIVIAKEPILSIDVEIDSGGRLIPKTIRWYGTNSAAITLRKPVSCEEVVRYRMP